MEQNTDPNFLSPLPEEEKLPEVNEEGWLKIPGFGKHANPLLTNAAVGYYSKKDNREYKPQEALDAWISDATWAQTNLASAVSRLIEANTDDPEQVSRLKTLHEGFEQLPGVFEKGGRGAVGIAKGLGQAAIDPIGAAVGIFTGGIGRIAAKGVMTTASAAIKTAGEIVANNRTGVAVQGALQTGAGNYLEQEKEIELGIEDTEGNVKKDTNWGEVAANTAAGAGLGVAADLGIKGAIAGGKTVGQKLGIFDPDPVDPKLANQKFKINFEGIEREGMTNGRSKAQIATDEGVPLENITLRTEPIKVQMFDDGLYDIKDNASRVGNIPLWHINSKEDALHVVRETARTIGEGEDVRFGNAKPLEKSPEVVRRHIEDMMGLPDGHLEKDKKFRSYSIAEAESIGAWMKYNLEHTVKVYRMFAANPTDGKLEAAFDSAMTRARLFQELVYDVRAEAGRKLDFMKKMFNSGSILESVEKYKGTVASNYSQEKVFEMAESLGRILDDEMMTQDEKFKTMSKMAMELGGEQKGNLKEGVAQALNNALLVGTRSFVKNFVTIGAFRAVENGLVGPVAWGFNKIEGAARNIIKGIPGSTMEPHNPIYADEVLANIPVIGAAYDAIRLAATGNMDLAGQRLKSAGSNTLERGKDMVGVFAGTKEKKFGKTQGGYEGKKFFESTLPGVNGSPLPNTTAGVAKSIIGYGATLGERLHGSYDEWHQGLAYMNSIRNQAIHMAKKNNMTFREGIDLAERWTQEAPESVKNIAMEAAARVTATDDPGKMAKNFSKFLGSIGSESAGPFIKHVLSPFITTVANLTRMGMEYTPAGVLLNKTHKAIMNSIDPVTGTHDPRARSYAIARMTVGTGLMYTAAKLYEDGKITLPWETNPGVRKTQQATHPPSLSLKIGDKWVDIDWLDPLSQAMTLGVIAKQASDEANDPLSKKSAEQIKVMAIAGIAHAIMNKSIMSNFSKAILAAEDPERFGSNFMNAAATMFVPPFLHQMDTVNDPSIKEVRSMVDAIRNRMGSVPIPFTTKDRSSLVRQLDVWGNDRIEEKPLGIGNEFIDRTFSPFKNKSVSTDPVAIEASKLKLSIKDPPRRVGRLELTPEDVYVLKYYRGKIAHQAIERLMSSSSYTNMPPDLRRNAMSDIVSKSTTVAKELLGKQNPKLREEMEREKLFQKYGIPYGKEED